jgi:hypothetical protein
MFPEGIDKTENIVSLLSFPKVGKSGNIVS